MCVARPGEIHRPTSSRIDAMVPADIPAVVELQLATLNGSIVTELGATFLTRFHLLALSHPRVHAFVARGDDGLGGFAVCTTDITSFNQFMTPRLLLPMMRALAAPSRFHLWPSLARKVFEHEPPTTIPAELLLLAVHPRARRRGFGATLVHAVEQTFRDRGIERYRVAVRSHLDLARAFYAALEFEPEAELTIFGRPMVYLTKDVHEP